MAGRIAPPCGAPCDDQAWGSNSKVSAVARVVALCMTSTTAAAKAMGDRMV